MARAGASHAKNKIAGRIMHFSAWNTYIPVVAGNSRRCGMAPAHIPVFISQKPSTHPKHGIHRPSCNLILSVDSVADTIFMQIQASSQNKAVQLRGLSITACRPLLSVVRRGKACRVSRSPKRVSHMAWLPSFHHCVHLGPSGNTGGLLNNTGLSRQNTNNTRIFG